MFVLAFVRCSAPSTCVRNSDCMDGEMCVNGGCYSASSGDPTATSSVTVSDDASTPSTPSATDASTIPSNDASADAGTADSASDASDDASTAAD